MNFSCHKKFTTNLQNIDFKYVVNKLYIATEYVAFVCTGFLMLEAICLTVLPLFHFSEQI